SSRLSERCQLTTDGRSAYVSAIVEAFPARGVDYAVLMKTYGSGSAASARSAEARYSPAPLVSVEKIDVLGSPDGRHVSTSYVERANLTMRMGMRRMTRLTNGFSKKFENLRAAVALHFMHYNF